jgi:hypothetical protein
VDAAVSCGEEERAHSGVELLASSSASRGAVKKTKIVGRRGRWDEEAGKGSKQDAPRESSKRSTTSTVLARSERRHTEQRKRRKEERWEKGAVDEIEALYERTSALI